MKNLPQIVTVVVVVITVAAGAYLLLGQSSEDDVRDPPQPDGRAKRVEEASPVAAATPAETVSPRPSTGPSGIPGPDVQGAASLRLSAGESGVVEHDSGARVEIPSGVFSESVTVSISEVESPLAELPDGVELGRVFDVSVGQADLAGPIAIHIPYEARSGTTAEDVMALHWDDELEGWEMIEGEVDESAQVVRVEVSDLSWFSTLIRDLTGLYDYTSEDAQIKSCEVSSESVESSREFSISAEVDNRSVEEAMHLEVVITDKTRGHVQRIESEGKRMDTGSTHEFRVSERLYPPGKHEIQCILKVGLTEEEAEEIFALGSNWDELKHTLLGWWLAPELHRVDRVVLKIDRMTSSSTATADLTECSASVADDGGAILTANPRAIARVGKSINYKVGFVVYHEGEEVFKHVSDPKQKKAKANDGYTPIFSKEREPWTAEYLVVEPGEYTLDCMLIGYVLEFREESLAFEIVAALQDPFGAGRAMGNLIKRHNVVLEWYSSADFDWPVRSVPDNQDGGPILISVSAGSIHTCGVLVDGTVDCWGDDEYGQSSPVSGKFVSVSTGGRHTCGVLVDGTVDCWGDDEHGQSSPVSGEFVSVSTGGRHTCGVLVDGTVDCWGDDEHGQSSPVSGEFVSVSTGGRHTCGVLVDGTVDCWGDDEHGQSSPVSGEFVSASAGGRHTCGVLVDGTVDCWGDDEHGQSSPLSGEFVSVSAGGRHTCGVLVDGTVDCWGDDYYRQSSPLSGEFIFVSTGGRHTCGVLVDGTVDCWGSHYYRQSSPPSGRSPSSVTLATTGNTGIYEDLLGSIPDTPEARRAVHITDYDKVREVFDLTIASPHDEDFRMLMDDFRGGDRDTSLYGVSDVFLGPFDHTRFANVDVSQRLRYLGFDYSNMEQSVHVQWDLHRDTEVIKGRFDPRRTDEALNSCTECAPHDLGEYRGIQFYSWGQDYSGGIETRYQAPAFDDVGRGGRIAVLDSYVLRTLATPLMEWLIDANRNEVPSLADVPTFQLLADGMSRLEAYFMRLSDRVDEWDVAAPDQWWNEEGDLLVGTGPWLRPYEAYGIGLGVDENGSYLALVVVNADDHVADENVELLRRIVEEEISLARGRPWLEIIDVSRSEIRATGRILLAKLRGTNPREILWWNLLVDQDSLLLHE